MTSIRHTPLPGAAAGTAHDTPAPPLEDRVDPQAESDPLLAAARDVIMTHGPRRATLTEVARQAGVSRMTVYRRFDSFDRLISALLTAELADILGEIPATSGDTAHERAVDLIVAGTEAISDHPLVRRVLAVDPEYLTPLMVQRFGQTQRASAALIEPLLAAGMTTRGGDGTIRDTDPAGLALACVTAVQSFIFAAPALDARPEGAAARAQVRPLIAGLLRPTDSAPTPAPAPRIEGDRS
ncbi:MAG: TetR/AcrR family transcriptional regulator [Candidatus Nanopelagicales bacterium]